MSGKKKSKEAGGIAVTCFKGYNPVIRLKKQAPAMNKSMTRFSQLMNHFPKREFHKIVKEEKCDKYLKTLKTWDMLNVMLYGQISQSVSLRRLVNGFNSHINSHYHLNTNQVKRSTISEALTKRSVEPFKQICENLMNQASRKEKKSCREFISIIDSSPISLLGKGYEWALKTRNRKLCGLKLHVELESSNDAPTYINITKTNINDITDTKNNIKIKKGVTYVVDKGYFDFNWWYIIEKAGSNFVTRVKTNTAYKVIRNQQVAQEHKDIIQEDQIIHLTNKAPRGGKINHYALKDLRLVTVIREGKKPMGLITNDMKRTAREIANLYKQRWQIELFFKWIKQKLKLKSYFGTSENAVRIQIYVALITYLLMKLLQMTSKKWNKMLDVHTWLQSGLFVKDNINTEYYRRRRQNEKLMNKLQIRFAFA